MSRFKNPTGLARLTLVLAVFFTALVLPSGVLIWQAFDQLKWEAFHRHRLMAEETVARLDQRLSSMVASQNALAFTDFSFLNASSNLQGGYQLSPLAAYPVQGSVPGTLGYFEVSHDGAFSTPHLPVEPSSAEDWGMTVDELAGRRILHQHLYMILENNSLLAGPSGIKDFRQRDAPGFEAPKKDKPPAEAEQDFPVHPQQAFDDLKQNASVRSKQPTDESTSTVARVRKNKLGRVDELRLENVYEQKLSDLGEDRAGSASYPASPSLRREQNVLPSAVDEDLSNLTPETSSSTLRIFESEIAPFDFTVLATGHYLLYRRAWRDQEPFTQGVLIAPEVFLSSVIEDTLRGTAVSRTSDIAVAFQGNVLRWISEHGAPAYRDSSDDLAGTLLMQTTLVHPFNQLELIFSVNQLPAGEAGKLLTWTSLILMLVLCAGFTMMFFLGRRQINLAQQQQDFVSAVSHELKTPLTSIRMYGEMLRENWVDEDRRKTYYDYIFNESERLTRLINNVLQLARINRNDLAPNLRSHSIAELLDGIKSRTTTQTANAGFEVSFACDGLLAEREVYVDEDYISQIFINLVDNAIKFSARSDQRRVDIGCTATAEDRVQFTVRDFGPGIEAGQLRNIFELFYRVGNELTRDTAGTGIGLSLVKQLVDAMDGEIDVLQREPGTEFAISLPLK